MNIAYVSAIRFPSERAHALYMALVLEAFLSHADTVEVIVPRRFARDSKTAREYFGIRHDIPVRYLPTIDITFVPFVDRFAYFCYISTFLISLILYAFWGRKKTLFFTHDMVSALVLSYITPHVVYEMHDYPGKRFRFLYARTLTRVGYLLVNTAAKEKDLMRDFGIAEGRCIVAPNGVEYDFFASAPSRADARRLLGLPADERIALYTGSLFAWKGVDTLAQAGAHTSTEIYFVGGGEVHLKKFSDKYAHQRNVHVRGHVPHADMPLWLRAADVLVVPNTATSELSASHTSPMKLFEYMASGTPIVATDVPSLKEILREDEGWYVAPDDPRALASVIDGVSTDPRRQDVVTRAQVHAKHSSWSARAEAILARIDVTTIKDSVL